MYSKAEEYALITAAQAGDIKARNALIEANLGLIWKITIGFCNRYKKYQSDELIGVAVLGYIACIKRFDISKGFRLSTYSVKAIINHLRRYAQENRSIIRVAYAALEGRGSEKVLRDAERALGHVENLDHKIPDKTKYVSSHIPELEDINEAIKSLPDRQQKIMLHRIAGKTLGEVGDIYDLTKERVRQIEAMAREHIREKLKLSPAGRPWE